MDFSRTPKSFLDDIVPVDTNAIQTIKEEALANHKERKQAGYDKSRALAGQAKKGIKKRISPELIEEIIAEFEKKPPVPKFRRQSRNQKEHRVNSTFDNSVVFAETSDLSLEGFSHVSVVRSLKDDPPSPPKPIRKRGQTMLTHRTSSKEGGADRGPSPVDLSVSEKIARRTQLVKIESERVLQLIREKQEKAEDFKRRRVARKARQDLQKVWLLTLAHMSRMG